MTSKLAADSQGIRMAPYGSDTTRITFSAIMSNGNVPDMLRLLTHVLMMQDRDETRSVSTRRRIG